MLAPRHKDALENIKSLFTESNYNLSFLLLNIHDWEGGTCSHLFSVSLVREVQNLGYQRYNLVM
jgi:hypothetical protein